MPKFEVECPRCKTELEFRASDGDIVECEVCDLEFETCNGEALFDCAEAKVRAVEFECVHCRDGNLLTWTVDGETTECPDCELEYEIRRGRAYFDPSDIRGEKVALVPLQESAVARRSAAAEADWTVEQEWDRLPPAAQVVALVGGVVILGGITYAIATAGAVAVLGKGVVTVAVGKAAKVLAKPSVA